MPLLGCGLSRVGLLPRLPLLDQPAMARPPVLGRPTPPPGLGAVERSRRLPHRTVRPDPDVAAPQAGDEHSPRPRPRRRLLPHRPLQRAGPRGVGQGDARPARRHQSGAGRRCHPPRADVVACVAESLAAVLRDYAEDVRVIPNGLPAQYLDRPRDYEAAGRPLNVGWAGTSSTVAEL